MARRDQLINIYYGPEEKEEEQDRPGDLKDPGGKKTSLYLLTDYPGPGGLMASVCWWRGV